MSDWDRCEELMDFDKLELVANYLDIYYGLLTGDKNAPFVADVHEIMKYKVQGLSWELNTMKCDSLSAAGFLVNNDINITAS